MKKKSKIMSTDNSQESTQTPSLDVLQERFKELRKQKEDALEVGDKVYFESQKSPMTLKARSERFLILTEPFYRQKTVYHSIVDLEKQWKAPNDLVLNKYDYENQDDINECLRDLMAGTIGLSQRRGVELDIDWERTEARKAKVSKK